MNNTYNERQYSLLIMAISVIIMAGLTLSWVNGWGTNPLPTVVYLFMMVMFAAIGLLFYDMKTTIDNQNITIIYGIGAIKFIIPMGRIASVRCVRGRWYHGAGIRYIPNGMLYSINFTDAIEICDRNSTRKIRIGTQNPEELADQITTRLIQNSISKLSK